MSILSSLSRLWFRYSARVRNTRYHWRTADWSTIRGYQERLNGTRRLPIAALMIASWRHGASFADFFQFRFFDKGFVQRTTYITTSLRHEITRQLNDPSQSEILRDKALFATRFADLIGRPVWTWAQLLRMPALEAPPRLVVKLRRGQQGSGMYFPGPFSSWAAARQWLEGHVADLGAHVFEPFLDQHPALEAVSPGCVNTLRVVTLLRGDEVEIWGVVMRFGVGHATDHFSRGGLAAIVSASGVIDGLALKKDPSFQPCTHHPVTRQAISGMKVPWFDAVLSLAKQAAKRLPGVRSVGWDICIKPGGPCLIEGNDNWNCATVQVPLQKGIRYLAESVCDLSIVYD